MNQPAVIPPNQPVAGQPGPGASTLPALLSPEERELVGIVANVFIRNDKDRAWIKALAGRVLLYGDGSGLWPNGRDRLHRICRQLRPQIPKRLHKVIGGSHG